MITVFLSTFTVIEIPNTSIQSKEKEYKQMENVPGTGYIFFLGAAILRIEYQDNDYLPGLEKKKKEKVTRRNEMLARRSSREDFILDSN